MKHLQIVFCLLLITSSVFSQVTRQDTERRTINHSVFGIGFASGLTSGFGLSLRHHIPGGFSYQVIGGVVKTDSRTHYDFGLETQYDFSQGEMSRFFACGAFGYFYSGDEGMNELNAPRRTGLGAGLEYGGVGSLALTGELLFTFFNDGVILPLPQVSAHYYIY